MNNPPIFRSYGQGAESARNFFKCSLFHEKRGLEVPNVVTFPNSLTLPAIPSQMHPEP